MPSPIPPLTALSENSLHYLTLEQKIVRSIWKRKKSVILTKKDKNRTKIHLTRNIGLCFFIFRGLSGGGTEVVREAVKVTADNGASIQEGFCAPLNTLFLGCKVQSPKSTPSLHALPFL